MFFLISHEGIVTHIDKYITLALYSLRRFKNQNRFENEKDFNKLGRTFYGVIGAGAIGITKTPPPSEGVICTTTRSHSNKLVNAALQAVKPTEVLKVGGSGHKVLLLIEGKAHAYVFPSPGCKKWDTCAPEAILHSLGGKVSPSIYQ